MDLDEFFGRLCREAPLACMARTALTHVFRDEAVDRIFRDHARRQYEGELAFSAVVKLMFAVSCRIRPTVNSAFRQYGETIGVSVTSVYNKLKGIEPEVTRAIVKETARSMAAVAAELGAPRTEIFPGYATRIIDGSHLEASQHRLEATRASNSAPLPGVGLVVLDPASRLILDYIPCEDAYAQERSLLPAVIDDLQPGQVWIADRNFCTSAFLQQLHASRAFFVIRKHASNVTAEAAEPEISRGSCETGELFEQSIELPDDLGGRFRARRIRVVLEKRTRNGDRELVLLTNLPAEISAEQVAAGYRERWSIESAFGEIRRCLNGEINALGYPKAALFSFGMALVSFNVLSLLADAIGAANGAEAKENFSTQQASVEINFDWRATLLLGEDFWFDPNRAATPAQAAEELKRIAAHVGPKMCRKYKRPKVNPPPQRAAATGATAHVATARLLEGRK